MNSLAGRLRAFINAEGHITDVETDENGTTLLFRSRGLKYHARAIADDDTYLQLSCAMILEPGVVFNTPLLRAILACQDRYKCVKFSLREDDAIFVSSVEWFFAEPDGFKATFWRSVGLIEAALYAGMSEIQNHSTKIAAGKFIAELSSGGGTH